jgi:hypothetical protein
MPTLPKFLEGDALVLTREHHFKLLREKTLQGASVKLLLADDNRDAWKSCPAPGGNPAPVHGGDWAGVAAAAIVKP